MSLAEKIREKRIEKGISQTELAKQMGVAKQTIGKYEDGTVTNIPLSRISQMAVILGTTEAYLMGWDKINAQPYAPTYRAPVFERISAGQPLLANENAIGYEYIDRKDDADYFILRVSGDSMNAARINDGDQIIVRQQDDVDDGDIAVVLVNGNDATVKRIRRQNNTVMLIPMSTNTEHQVQVYGPDVPIKVLGKVVEVKFKV